MALKKVPIEVNLSAVNSIWHQYEHVWVWLVALPGVTMFRSGENMSTQPTQCTVTRARSCLLSCLRLRGPGGQELRSPGRSLPTTEEDTNIVFVQPRRDWLRSVSEEHLSCLILRNSLFNGTMEPERLSKVPSSLRELNQKDQCGQWTRFLRDVSVVNASNDAS